MTEDLEKQINYLISELNTLRKQRLHLSAQNAVVFIHGGQGSHDIANLDMKELSEVVISTAIRKTDKQIEELQAKVQAMASAIGLDEKRCA